MYSNLIRNEVNENGLAVVRCLVLFQYVNTRRCERLFHALLFYLSSILYENARRLMIFVKI